MSYNGFFDRYIARHDSDGYACATEKKINEARERKDYIEADRLKTQAVSRGYTVSIDKVYGAWIVKR